MLRGLHGGRPPRPTAAPRGRGPAERAAGLPGRWTGRDPPAAPRPRAPHVHEPGRYVLAPRRGRGEHAWSMPGACRVGGGPGGAAGSTMASSWPPAPREAVVADVACTCHRTPVRRASGRAGGPRCRRRPGAGGGAPRRAEGGRVGWLGWVVGWLGARPPLCRGLTDGRPTSPAGSQRAARALGCRTWAGRTGRGRGSG